ncbi:MAG: alpha/beta fold hydrolase [Planctomycetes bacterium]|nr:alpha/beta fold hydrolase [Planctomycetota bacterium]
MRGEIIAKNPGLRLGQGPRRWLKAFLVGMAVLFAALAFLTLKLSRDITEVERRPPVTDPLAVERLGAHRVEFNSADGVKLVGLWIPAVKAIGTVVCCHGRGSGKEQFLRGGQSAFLQANGYSSLLFDFRATGESGGRHCTLGDLERGDLCAALEEARRRGGGVEPILWGVSMGAVTALLVAADHPGIPLVIAENPYDSFVDTVEHHHRLRYHLPRWPMTPLVCWLTEVRTGCRAEAVDAVGAASRLRGTRLLQVHCEKDVRTPERVQRRIYDRAAGDKELYIVPGAPHGKAFEAGGDAYRRKLQEHLSHGSGRSRVL